MGTGMTIKYVKLIKPVCPKDKILRDILLFKRQTNRVSPERLAR